MPKNCLEDKTEKKEKKKDSQQKSLFLEKARQGMEITALCFFVCSVNYLKPSNKTKALTFMSLYSSFMPPTSSMFLLSHMRAITIIGMDICP